MNILLDTHLAIWLLFDDNKLSKKARNFVLNPNNTIFYSVVNTWEVLLKHRQDPNNMLTDVSQFVDACRQSGYLPLNLCDEHVAIVETLSLREGAPEHKDPFDKLLLAQAKKENFLLLTHDEKLSYYDEPCVIMV